MGGAGGCGDPPVLIVEDPFRGVIIDDDDAEAPGDASSGPFDLRPFPLAVDGLRTFFAAASAASAVGFSPVRWKWHWRLCLERTSLREKLLPHSHTKGRMSWSAGVRAWGCEYMHGWKGGCSLHSRRLSCRLRYSSREYVVWQIGQMYGGPLGGASVDVDADPDDWECESLAVAVDGLRWALRGG